MSGTIRIVASGPQQMAPKGECPKNERIGYPALDPTGPEELQRMRATDDEAVHKDAHEEEK